MVEIEECSSGPRPDMVFFRLVLGTTIIFFLEKRLPIRPLLPWTYTAKHNQSFDVKATCCFVVILLDACEHSTTRPLGSIYVYDVS